MFPAAIHSTTRRNVMKTLTVIFTLATIIFATPAVAAEDNPFGLDLDKHPTEYGCSQLQNDKHHYRCETVPKPRPEFEFYAIQYVERVGICLASGIGKKIGNDKHGLTTKKRVDAIAKQLKQKYGVETQKYDRLLPGSMGDAPGDWMMGIRRKERSYLYRWDPDEGFKPVGEVVQLAVAAQAVSDYTGYVKVDFHFKSNPQCDAIIEKAGQDAF